MNKKSSIYAYQSDIFLFDEKAKLMEKGIIEYVWHAGENSRRNKLRKNRRRVVSDQKVETQTFTGHEGKLDVIGYR